MPFRLRPELIPTPLPDGGLELYDPLLERFSILSAAEVAALPALPARLQGAMLEETPAAALLRAQFLAARRAAPPRHPPLAGVAALDWEAAVAALPAGIAPEWRREGVGERLRRLAEERAAGRRRVILRGWLAPALVQALQAEAEAAPVRRQETALLRAGRLEGRFSALQEILDGAAVRRVLGALLGVPLDQGGGGETILNGWRMSPGDFMGVHPDGPRYQATFVVGLCAGWTAEDGGAIAFGVPGGEGEGLAVQERWLPHAGDVCLFVPEATSWHQVEPPRHRTRWTLSGWWLAAPPP